MTTQPAAPAPVRPAHRRWPAPPQALAALALVATVSLAGCGSATPPAGSTTGSTAQPTATATPPSAGSSPSTATGALLWPVTDTTQATALQHQVDQGSQAWLLDPSEVATNYATTVLQWRAPSAGAPDGGTVVITDPDSGSVTLTLVQPATTGSTGVWIVSAERRN